MTLGTLSTVSLTRHGDVKLRVRLTLTLNSLTLTLTLTLRWAVQARGT